MSQQFLYVGPLREAPDEFLWAAGLEAARAEAHCYEGAVTVLDHGKLVGPEQEGVWTLALSLPYSSEFTSAQAQVELDAQNAHSPDLLECRTVLVLEAEGYRVRIDDYEFHRRYRDFAPETLLIGIVSQDKLVVVRHDWGEDGFESFQAGRQAAAASSGPNYNPYRIWTEEQLAEAARNASARRDYKVFECRFFVPKADAYLATN